MRLTIGEVLALICPTCQLTLCPCGGDRPVAFVRGICAVPTLRARRVLGLFGQPAPRGAGRHRRRPRPLIGVFAR
jgi:hypothetical protein